MREVSNIFFNRFREKIREREREEREGKKCGRMLRDESG